LIEAVREQGFEGIVAKRRNSLYEPGKRSGARQKMRVLQKRDFVIGGYIPAGGISMRSWSAVTRVAN
jgi:bifunctional non-homologous end joining protein LigD